MVQPSTPLEGVLVVSLEQAVAAPLASYRLAEAGARVVKVERPEGDFARGYDDAANGMSSYFAWINRGKESVALDLRSEPDRSVMDGLLARADVFIQNLAVGAAVRLGYGAEALRAQRPELIVCDISGYGADGPYAPMKAYDLLVQAESGLLSVSGPPGPVGRIGVSIADIATGTTAALAITQALYRKAATGEGAHLATSLFETMADWMTVPLLHQDYRGRAPERVGLAHPSIAPYGGFVTADGDTILISVQSDREWGVLCRQVLDRPDLATDPDLATNADRVANRARTDAAVAAGLERLSTVQAKAGLSEARIAFGMVNEVADLSTHPQLRRVTATHPGGTVELPAPPVRTDWATSGAVPAIDQNGDAIRVEFGTAGGPAVAILGPMAEETPPRFRKTKNEKWAVMAPVPALEKALAEGGKIDVQRKSGDWSTFVVASLGRPFDVDGVEMCYGYGPDDGDDTSGSSGSSGSASTSTGSSAGGQARSSARAPRRRVADAPPPDPSEPLPEYQGGPEDEWQDGF